MNGLAGLPALAQLPGFEEAIARHGGGDPRRSGQVRDRRARSAERGRRSRRRAPARRRHGGDTSGIQGRLPPVLRARLERPRQGSGVRRPGHAAPRSRRDRRNVERGQHGVRAVPDAHRRRDRGDRDERLRCVEANVSAEDGERRVDRHDEPDRAAGRVRSRGRAHEGGAAGRTAATSSTATRSSSPTASTTTPTTSCTSCWRARRMRRRASRASRCSSCRSSSSSADGTPGARNDVRCVSHRAQARHPRRVPPPCSHSATPAARSAIWSARRTAASSTCS